MAIEKNAGSVDTSHSIAPC